MSDWILPDSFSCGYFDSREVYAVPRTPTRSVTMYEIELFLEDGRAAVLNSHEIPIRRDLVLVARPGDVRCSLLHFKTVFLKFPVRGALAETLDALPQSFVTAHGEAVRAAMHEIILLSDARKPDPLLLHSRFLALVSLLCADARGSLSLGEQELETIRRAKLFIQTHYAQKIATRDVAAAVNLSESYFRSLFRAACGRSPHQFLTDTRIEAAKQMLWHTGVSLPEIAENCGFGTQSYLNDVFKRETGRTPGAYRAEFARRYAI